MKPACYARAAKVAVVLGVATLNAACEDRLPGERSESSVRSDISVSSLKIESKKVLLVHSYHSDNPWVAAVSEGVQGELLKKGITVETFYMDTRRNADELWKRQAGEVARKKVDEVKPGVVIAADDNAQQYFAKGYVGSNIPIVFCGVSADPGAYGYPAKNVTGVLERPNPERALKLLSRFGSIKTFALLSSADPSSTAAIHFMKRGSYSARLVDSKLVSRFEDWKVAVRGFNRKVDAVGIYMYDTLRQADSNQRMDPAEVIAWTRAHLEVPSFGFFSSGVEEGLLLGVVESGQEHGSKAATYAARILTGASPESLPLQQASPGTEMINGATAEMLGIELGKANLLGLEVVGRGAMRGTHP